MAKKKKKSWSAVLDLLSNSKKKNTSASEKKYVPSKEKKKENTRENTEVSVPSGKTYQTQRRENAEKQSKTENKKREQKSSLAGQKNNTSFKSSKTLARMDFQRSAKNTVKKDEKEVRRPSFEEDRSKDIGPIREKEERTWFQKSKAFEDGYQMGDVARTIAGTATDVSYNMAAGAIGMGESILDGLLAAGQAGEMYHATKLGKEVDYERLSKEKPIVEKFIKADLYDEQEIARKLIAEPAKKIGFDIDDSVLGEKSDSVAQSAGQFVATTALGAIQVTPWWLITGLTSMGGETENALNQGATYEEAAMSGLISAGGEVLSEKLSGGISYGGKTLDSKTIDMLSTKISSKVGRTLAKLGIEGTGEGLEEVFSSVVSRLGSKLYREENINVLLTSEEAMDEYIESFVGGAALSGVIGGVNVAKSKLHGVDYTTGLTENEQKVVQREVDTRIAERENDGKKLSVSEKAKIRSEVYENLKKGYIDIDSIERTLGGEAYEKYKAKVDQEATLKKAYEEAGRKTEDGLDYIARDEQRKAYEDAKKAYEDFKNKGEKDALRQKLTEEMERITEKDFTLRESYNEKGRRSKAYEADVENYSEDQRETIRRAIDSGILNNTNRTHEFVDLVAKIAGDKGVVFDFTNNERLKSSGFAIEGKAVNGFVKEGNITINIESVNALNTVVGHEITHVMEGTELYSELQTVIKNYATTMGDYQTRYESVKEKYKDIDGVNIENEVTAELVGEYLFNDTDFVKRLSVEQPSIFRKIFEEVKYMIKSATSGSKEAKELEKVKKVFSEAYRETKAINENTSSKVSNEALKGETKYSYAGKNAETSNKNALLEAYEMLSAGESDLEIFQKTGWTRGADGKWRFEIDDSNATVDRNGEMFLVQDSKYKEYESLFEEVVYGAASERDMNRFEELEHYVENMRAEHENKTLKDYMDHQELYKAYPFLSNVPVKTMELEPGVKGEYRLREGIVINKDMTMEKQEQNLKKALLHETQHIIQHYERFAMGANTNTWQGYDIQKNSSKLYEAEKRKNRAFYGGTEEFRNLIRRLNQLQIEGDFGEEYSEIENKLYNKYEERYFEYDNARFEVNLYKDSESLSNAEKYRMTAGEIEARDVAERSEWDEAERKSKLPMKETENGVIFAENLDNPFEYREGNNQTRYSVSEIVGEKGDYGLGVILDTDIFDNVHPRNWGKILQNHVYNNLAGSELTIYNDGVAEMVYIAGRNERVTKDGSNNSRKVVDKLAHHRYGDNIRTLSVAHIDELTRTSKYMGENVENTHQWLDENGWEYRTTYAQDNSGRIYEMTLNIGKARDGRNILYDINKIKRIDNGIVPSKVASQNINSLMNIVSDNSQKSSTKYSISEDGYLVNPEGKAVTLETSEVGSYGTLMAIRNIDEAELGGMLELNGIPVPSIAITDPNKVDHSDFGPISVLFGKDTIDPANAKNEVYDRDVWSARFPKVEYEVDMGKASEIYKRARENGPVPLFKAVSFEPRNLEESINRAGGENAFIEQLKDDVKVKNLYLAETSSPVEVVKTEKVKELTVAEKERFDYILSKMSEEIADIKNMTGKEWNAKYIEQFKEVQKEAWKKQNPEVTNEELVELVDSVPRFRQVQLANKIQEYTIDGGKTVNVVDDYEATERKIVDSVDQVSYEKWLKELFKGLEKSKGISNGSDLYTASGDRRNFKQTHDSFTLENIVKNMTKGRTTGSENTMFGVTAGAITSNMATRFDSIDDIKNAEGRITPLADELVQPLKDNLYKNIEKLKNYYKYQDSFNADTSAKEAIFEFSTNELTEGNLRKILKEYSFKESKISSMELQDIIQSLNDLKKIPTDYFEAKPQRAVGLDEIQVVVIPESTSSDLKERLSKQGINMIEYDPNIVGDRQRKINQFDNLKFSISEKISETEFDAPVRADHRYQMEVEESDNEMFFDNDLKLEDQDSKMQDLTRTSNERIKKIRAKIDGYKVSRDVTVKEFDASIREKTEMYNALERKDSKKASRLMAQIESLKVKKQQEIDWHEEKISGCRRAIENVEVQERSYTRRSKQQEYRTQIRELIGDTSTWQDKKMGIQYQINTLRRNLRDIVRNADGSRDIARADAIYDLIQGNYNKNEASLNRESNAIKDEYRNLKITKAEDAYIQMLGEYKYNPDTTITPEVLSEYYEKNKKNIDMEKVDTVIEKSRVLYDSLFKRVNSVLREHGFKEIGYREGYFPHFSEENQSWIAKALNWRNHNSEIPTDIAGLTEQFKPERSWQSFSQHRTGDSTQYSFMKGLDTYLQGSLDWIYHIEDIQRRRALENEIRYQHSEKGIKEQIDQVRNDPLLDADQVQEKMDSILKNARNPLGNFVTDLQNGTNNLAGKKSSVDRTMEYATNRKIYSTMTNISNRVSGNMVAGSLSSALTNFIPITQSWAEVSPTSSVKAMKETLQSYIRDDGMVNKSDFLTNRLKSSENLYKNGWDKANEGIGCLMECIDSFTSQVVWRSKYDENVQKGMTEADAIKNADQFSENVMAGRSRGNMPTIFNSKSPATKVFTAFQLEVANQYAYMFKDLPQDIVDKSMSNLVLGYAKMFVGAYAYNALYSSLVGRNAAFDPVRIIQELIGDFEDDEVETVEMLENFASNVVDELPFVGGVAGGGRIPIASALPYGGLTEMIKGSVTDIAEKDWKSLGLEWMNPVYYVAMPMGGGQIRKTVQGLSMFDDEHPISGSYTSDGSLRYAVEDTPLKRIQAAAFGRNSVSEAREYYEKGRKPIKESKLNELLSEGVSVEDYWKVKEEKNSNAVERFDEKVKINKTKAQSEEASEADLLQYKYMNNVKTKLSELQKQKEEIQKSKLSDTIKKTQISSLQKEMDEIAEKALREEKQVQISGNYGKIGNQNYLKSSDGSWTKMSDEQYVKQKKAVEKLGITAARYWKDKEDREAYDWAVENSESYEVAKAVTKDVLNYWEYRTNISNLRADKDSNGKSISGSRKKKVLEYINGLDLAYEQKMILFKKYYPSDDRYNNEIIEYLNGRDDIGYSQMETILKELGFNVDMQGNISW